MKNMMSLDVKAGFKPRLLSEDRYLAPCSMLNCRLMSQGYIELPLEIIKPKKIKGSFQSKLFENKDPKSRSK